MNTLQGRIRDKSLLHLVTDPEKLIPLFESTTERTLNIGWSGFTPVGYPKVMPRVLADHVEKNNLQGKWRFNLFTGASTGVDTEDRWAALNMIDRRWPYQTGKNVSSGINRGEIRMGDKHLSIYAQELYYGFYTKDDGGGLDFAFIEASAITENGDIVLTGAVGASTEIIAIADKIIVEINTGLNSFEGMHDICMTDRPPCKQVIPILHPGDRIGTTYVPTDKSKIIAIVESKYLDTGRELRKTDENANRIAEHIIDFLNYEVKMGRIPKKSLLPIQSGVGAVANAVVGCLYNSPFENMTVFTEVFQDTLLMLLDSGKCDTISCTSLSLSVKGFEKWWENYDKYKDKVILRPQQISNNPGVVRRLGVISMNTPVEVDFYGHVNSSLVGGTRMINGIGGSGDFLRNAYLSIVHTPSVRATAADPLGISTVVPKVAHVDHTEHDIDIVVTEWGLADMRGLAPKDRAKLVIEKCAHPEYKDYLRDYFERSCAATGMHHEPHILKEVYDMHVHLAEKGTMRFWNPFG